jgi:hypothetical protein
MAAKEVTAEALASLFFHYQAALAPDFGCEAEETANWEEIPANERKRMIAAARLTLMDLTVSDEARKTETYNYGYVGKEGREWGC